MSQESNLQAFATAVGTDVKTLSAQVAAIPTTDAYTKAEIGDINVDLVAVYNAAKA